MIIIGVYILLFSIVTALSVILMGSREIIAPEFTLGHLLDILTNWKFLLGIFFAFLTRVFFLLINNAIHSFPDLASSSTTITFLATTVSIFVVLLANYFFLGEKLSLTQGFGSTLIIMGIFLLFK